MAENLSTDLYRSADAASRDNRDNRGRFRPAQAEADRFWSTVDLSDRDGCWLWTGHTTADGYGRFPLTSSRREVRAHRYAWGLLNGPVPAGRVLDHLVPPDGPCTSTLCVRPSHLEPVTNSENLRRRHARRRAMNGASQ